MEFNLPRNQGAIIKVIGVGGGGSNAVNNMFKRGIRGVDFAICNTDKQAMDCSQVPCKIQLGPSLTDGLGAGSRPEIGREACIESLEDIRSFLADATKMVFVTAGLGGGTGTGAAPVIAKAAQELDILTVGIVTMPFKFEGKKRLDHALAGLEEMKKNVDTLIVISNEKLREAYGDLSISKAFEKADSILTMAARGIAEIITVAGYINVDFEDVNTVMRGNGEAIMGTGIGDGDHRALQAVKNAITSPLLEDNSIIGAKNILLNITSGKKETSMAEVGIITDFVQEEAGMNTNVIWGHCTDESLGDKICVTLIATGFEQRSLQQNDHQERMNDKPVRIPLEPDYEEEKHETVQFSQSQDDFSGHSLKDITSDSEEDDTADADAKPYRYTHNGPVNLDLSKKRNKPETVQSLPKNNVESHAPMVIKPGPVSTPKAEPPVMQRKNQLKGLSTLGMKLNNQETVNHMESEPAYKRRNPDFAEEDFSADNRMSDWAVDTEDQPRLNKNNNFLHKSVD